MVQRLSLPQQGGHERKHRPRRMRGKQNRRSAARLVMSAFDVIDRDGAVVAEPCTTRSCSSRLGLAFHFERTASMRSEAKSKSCGVDFRRAAGSTKKGERVVNDRVSIPFLGPKTETARPRPSNFDPVKRGLSDNLPFRCGGTIV